MGKIVLSFFIIIFTCLHSSSQTPTVQDCSGAIPICQDVYHEANSYSGTGNFQNEVNYYNSCLMNGEENSVWYTFTAQTSGNFSFIISPNNTSGLGDDYDWSVFDMTNAQCNEIYTNPSLEVSCNSWGSLYAFNGQTGASTAHGGYGNHNGPGETNGPEFNADLPVIAGNIYVMVISNFTGSTYGYTIDFSSSTAAIFDNIAPSIYQITSNIACGASSITFDFSENILCSTIAACDITITGPGGPYTVNTISGPNCASGGTQERTFTITFSPAISTTGNYNLNLNASNCNSVTDLCGNVAPSGSLPFTVTAITSDISNTVNSTCGQSNGSATVTASGGIGNYTYLWNTTPPQTTATATNLSAGSYIVTVSNGNCSTTDTAFISTTSNMSASITNIVNEACGMSDGSAVLNITGGTPPLNYNWNSNPPQSSQNLQNVPAGNYNVTVTDASSCTTTATVFIDQNPGPSATATSQDAVCNQSNGSATVVASGGLGTYTYLWSNGANTSTANGLSAGNYTVTVSDGGCSTSASVNVMQIMSTVAGLSIHPRVLTTMDGPVSFLDNSTGNAVSWQWDFGDGSLNGSGSETNHDYNNIGLYLITLIVTDDNGCTDTARDTVKVREIFTVYVPNSFTPDGNGINDYFYPQGINWDPDYYEMYIYDRWGNLVFQSKTIGEKWNGTINNSGRQNEILSMLVDIYAYVIRVKEMEGPIHEYTGKITTVK